MKRIVLLLAALLLALAGCKSGGAEDPLLKLSAEESLAQGKALLANQKSTKASKTACSARWTKRKSPRNPAPTRPTRVSTAVRPAPSPWPQTMRSW